MFRKSILLVLFLNIFSCLSAQNYTFWVAFTNKKNSPYSVDYPLEFLTERSLQRRIRQGFELDESDLPVNPNYIDSLKMLGATIVGASRWLNGVTISLDDTIDVVPKIRELSCVASLQLTKKYSSSRVSRNKMPMSRHSEEIVDSAFRQNSFHGLDALHKLGYKGDGIHVAILDAGFANVDRLSAFDSLRVFNRLLGVRDFVDASSDVYRQHAHGLAVLSTMAVNVPNVMVGAAPQASYWLLRTEDDATESLLELDNWVRAIEFADSVGVDVVNSSLGYSTFDDLNMNFSYEDMNGRTARISIAATMAARKGMLVVNSAGNDGSNSWHYISAPADADSIVTVGGVGYSGMHCSFSSYGPTSDNRIKPTVCSIAYDAYVMGTAGNIYGSVGTSFASPIIAGAVACLWQALPNLTNMQIIDLLKVNSSQFENPDNKLGYGIPDFYKTYNSVISKIEDIENVKILVSPNPFSAMLRFFLPKKAVVSIYDLMGNCVFLSDMVEDVQIDTSDWRNGVYLLCIKSKTECFVKKIIKK